MRILILGGTREARELAEKATGERGFEIVSSLAGRVREPVLPAGEVRVGGFGGVVGLRDWLVDNGIGAVIDATHPFAATMSAHAAEAASDLGLPVIQLRRPGYREQPGDRWVRVADLTAAAETVATLGERIFLSIGRQGVGAFAGLSRPWFLIRAIDPPTGPLPPNHEILLARGPFAVHDERRLLAEREIDVLVTKDSGGAATTAKLDAARSLRLPVVMIDRPPVPAGMSQVESVAAVWDWLRALS
ncbi:cobalt-precorrin-6A reductase [Nocardia sp. CDC159]|uniref:Cobalt-precorrin-6A reductase n=1 Tax=Nocardia pulmonis TaxID=2951408 RepID=A0A9X2EC32_9NOCA|nr:MULTISPECIES: cobalt-precorrin-6A reductase [Nocardia]MCM6775453.1 cobalt-precorrin-6A reductase [Nocardia pulmonis]MCM6787813.1 cobalt-precorrin-6A reductase [Nocardia sp. CDC159]